MQFGLLVYFEAGTGQVERVSTSDEPVIAGAEQLYPAGYEPSLPMRRFYEQRGGAAKLRGAQRIPRRRAREPVTAQPDELMYGFAHKGIALEIGLRGCACAAGKGNDHRKA